MVAVNPTSLPSLSLHLAAIVTAAVPASVAKMLHVVRSADSTIGSPRFKFPLLNMIRHPVVPEWLAVSVVDSPTRIVDWAKAR